MSLTASTLNRLPAPTRSSVTPLRSSPPPARPTVSNANSGYNWLGDDGPLTPEHEVGTSAGVRAAVTKGTQKARGGHKAAKGPARKRAKRT